MADDGGRGKNKRNSSEFEVSTAIIWAPVFLPDVFRVTSGNLMT